MPLTPGQKLGTYEVTGLLGSGGMGEVYCAKDINLGRSVAIKVLPDGLVNDSQARDRFEREAKAIAALSHPNIRIIHSLGKEDGLEYAVMELLDGVTLRDHLKQSGPMDWRDVLRIGSAIAEGLAASHHAGIVHRDIKPENIFITTDGQVKILDFGLARSKGSAPDPDPVLDLTQTVHLATTPGTLLGTLGYMSPEQARGQSANAASDIFSLGCILYEMISNVRPFARMTPTDTLAAILQDTPPHFKETGIPVHPDFERAIFKAMQKEPAARFGSGAELRQALTDIENSLSQTPLNFKSAVSLARKPKVAVPTTIVLAILVVLFVTFFRRQSGEHWARAEAIPQITKLVSDGDYLAAFKLAQEADKFIPTDPMLAQLYEQMSNSQSINTTPVGAEIYFKPYEDVDGPWQLLGTTPLTHVRLPRGSFRWRIEKGGYETVEMAGPMREEKWNSFVQELKDINLSTDMSEEGLVIGLDPEGSLPEGMIAVEGGDFRMSLTGLNIFQMYKLDRYHIDRYEVTNRQYKEFIEAGGYEKGELWKHPFVKDGKEIPFAEAVSSFKDKTGQPGPAHWELGDYPDSANDHPVGGVSWFEAAAYAEFRGLSLPTVYHWIKAALAGTEIIAPLSPSIVPLSNFDGEGPSPVGHHPAISISGAYDMAGNVREWCFNAGGDLRYSLGGAWNDPVYMFTQAHRQSPWERFPTNGFRCVKYDEGRDLYPLLTRPIDLPVPDYFKADNISDEAFNIYKSRYAYDSTPLDVKIEAVDESSEDWIRQIVTFDAAYPNERIIARIDLPRNAAPPYQPLIILPGAHSLRHRTYEEFPDEEMFRFVAKSGRAMIRPILAGPMNATAERPCSNWPHLAPGPTWSSSGRRI
jgi:serine/threonine protein kinase/formylglycine-generating enzyme required for sulfatase activity